MITERKRVGVSVKMATNAVVYVSGPITGNPEWQVLFTNAENELLSFNPKIEVVNPLRLSKELEKEFSSDFPLAYSTYMQRDIAELLKCNAICLLPGWAFSRGARLEYEIASALNMAVLEYFPKEL